MGGVFLMRCRPHALANFHPKFKFIAPFSGMGFTSTYMKVPPLALSGLLGVINNLPCKDSIIFLFICIYK